MLSDGEKTTSVVPDIRPLLNLADDLKPWAPVVVPIILFGAGQAKAIARRFQEHYKYDALETREQAIDNGAGAAQRLRDEVHSRIEAGDLTADQAKSAFARPDIAKHAQEAILYASETPDTTVHQELAALIVARLATPQDSRASIFLRMACDQLRYLNSEQLRLLGLTFALLHVGFEPEHFASTTPVEEIERAYQAYLHELDRVVAPFRDIEAPNIVDFTHFEELGLVRLEAWGGETAFTGGLVSLTKLLIPLQHSYYAKALATTGLTGPRHPTISWILKMMNGTTKGAFGIKSVRLSPIGFVIGKCMYSIAHGEAFTYKDADQAEE